MEEQKILDKHRRVRLPAEMRRRLPTDKVLFSECDGGILLEPFEDIKAKRPEYVVGQFGTNDRLTLPRKLSHKLGIGKEITLNIRDNGTIFISPFHAECLVCHGTKNLRVVGNHSGRYICDACLKQSE